MTLQKGARLGPYEITAPIGAGGMGEVYRGVDTRLHRTVAIKVLPDHLAADPERRDRFRREALAISSLNHPKICTLHDVGEAEGVHYLVLEHLEGETLSARIKHGPVPVEEALRLAAEMAEALDAAHRQGLIHRDLKPGNVMLTTSGLKLLDFGLAKALEGAVGDLSQAPTATSPVTAAGAVMGTLPYMAPEQIEGKQADARADIFALGTVLHEMITGRRAFHAESQTGLIAEILKEDPPPVSAAVPSARFVERCLHRCLAKNRDDRWQSARDLMHELRWLADGRFEEPGTAVAPGPSSRGWRPSLVIPGLACALAAGLVLGWMVSWSPSAVAARPVHAQITLPEGTQLNGWGSPVVAISPNGGAIAFVADDETGSSKLYVRRMDSPDAMEVPDSGTAEGPFFSPDGRWVAFAVGVSLRSGRAGELLKYSLDTGLTQPLAPVQDYFGGVWGDDDAILFLENLGTGFSKVPATGGTPRNVLPSFRENGEEVNRSLMWPVLLPGGRHVVATDALARPGRVVVVDLESGELTDPGIRGIRAFYSDDHHLFFADEEGSLFGVPFDPARRMPTGAPIALIDGISLARFDTPVLDISREGSLVYSQGFLQGSRIIPAEMVHLDAAGHETVLPFDPQLIYRGVSVSPAGDRLAAPLKDGSIWIYDIERGTRVRLLSKEAPELWMIAWSPDGLRIAFSTLDAKPAIMQLEVNGRGRPEPLVTADDGELYMGTWSPDGRGIVYGFRDDDGNASIRLKRFDDNAEARVLVEGFDYILHTGLSPDGRWLAFDAADTGDWEVYVQDLSGASDRVILSSGGGSNPVWSKDGRELYYYSSGRLMEVRVPQSPGERFGRPKVVLQADIEQEFCLDPKGGFYGYRPVPGIGRQTSLDLVLNWRQHLKW